MKFTEHMARLIASRQAAEEQAPIWRFATKVGARGLARAVKVEVPALWSMMGPPWCEPPPWEGCVIKPVSASGGRGVLPLERHEGWRGWRSLLGDGIQTWEEWKHWSFREHARHKELGVEPYNEAWLVEELVRRQAGNGALLLPYDWKCYAIGGRVAWVNQIDKTSSRNARSYRTRHWWRTPEGLEPSRDRIIHQPRQAAQLPRPRWEEELLEAADRIASFLRERTGSPFVRVDLYEDDDRGVLLGEITPHPSGGREVYDEEADHVLGRLWSGIE